MLFRIMLSLALPTLVLCHTGEIHSLVPDKFNSFIQENSQVVVTCK
jgi:hypothetical protein